MNAKPLSGYQCDRCGLCCRHLLVEASAIDVLREPRIEDVAPLMDKKHKKRIALPLFEATWVLAGDDGCEFLGQDNNCAIYATRPYACVAFLAGSVKCQELRSSHGLAPLPRIDLPTGITSVLSTQGLDYEDGEDF